MNVLIFNCGSSSQGFKVFRVGEAGQQPEVIASGKARNVATLTRAEAVVEWEVRGKSGTEAADLSSHRLSARKIIALLQARRVEIDAIGHRFVHGGSLFDRTVCIDAAALERLKQCLSFAPIHNPNSYSVIQVCLEQLPGVPQYAVFDTAFHAGMPDVSKTYAIPRGLAERHGFRKYGFHGLSYQYVSAEAARYMDRPLVSLKLILCHLGTGGSSVTAMKDGCSFDTSMGFSPLAGLVMSTRSGDLDPEIVLEMIRGGSSPDQVSDVLNNRSGLAGLSGYSSNLQEIIEEAEQGNAACQLAYEVYAQRLKYYLGAYTWLLDGADGIVFTDDIGLKSWKLREKVCGDVRSLGVEIDPAANRHAATDRASRISTENSRTQVWVIPTDEEIVILREVLTQA
jgi:acetate kinase